MSITLEKYINTKLSKIEAYKGKNLYSNIKAIENFLTLLMDIKHNLTKENVEIILRNKALFQYINQTFEIISEQKFNKFIMLLNDLNTQNSRFGSFDYNFLIQTLEEFYKKEEMLYEQYDVKEKEYKDTKDSMDYHKLWLSSIKNDIENQRVITDDSFVDFVSNDRLIDNKYKIILLREIEEFNKEAFSCYEFLSYDELKELLLKYSYKITNKSSLVQISVKYNSKVLQNILETIKKLKLHFSSEVLEKILVCGTSVQTINSAYNKIVLDKGYSLIAALKIYNFWTNAAYIPDNKEKNQSSLSTVSNLKTGDAIESENSINNLDDVSAEASELNSIEIFKTADYLKKYAFYRYDFDGMKSILKVPVEKLEKRENLIKLYGIDAEKIEGSMTLFSPYVITMLDQFIELDMVDYILKHTSSLSKPKSLPVVIYSSKKKGKEVLNVRNGNAYLDPSVNDEVGKFNDAVVDAGLCDCKVSGRKDYDEILNEVGTDKINPLIYKIPIVNYLENNYKENELQYKIGAYIFSRKKVLRIISSLVEKTNNIDFDMFLYAMTYQKIMDVLDATKIESLLSDVYEFSKKFSK